MAKVDTQSIPSELLDGYRGALGQERPDGGVRKRYPFEVPTMQTKVGHPSPKQKAQRARFLIAEGDFAGVDWATRQRWYAAMPEWGSFLWYYNFFIMSSLTGNANVSDGGAGMIKSIQVVKEEVPTTGEKAFAINAVDPAKTVVMLYGNSYISDKIQRGQNSVVDGAVKNIVLSPEVDPAISEIILRGDYGYEDIVDGTGAGRWGSTYVTGLIAAQLSVGYQALPGAHTIYFSWEIIEHLAQTIYPVIVSIAAEVITIDWSKVPSVAADVSIIVIEYI